MIDVEAIARKIKNAHCSECNVVRKIQCSACLVNDVLELLEGDTVDAVEVVHGRWEKAEYCGFVRCDQCKDVYIDESWLDDGRWKYCPNCGAKMDGERKDNE